MNKDILNRRIFEILRPEIGRMLQLMVLRDKLVALFQECLTAIIPDIKDRDLFPSEEFLLTFAQYLDLFVSLDIMKNMKGSMNNDLSMYKRAGIQFMKEQSEQEQMLLPKLGFFLATQDQFTLDIKKALTTMNSSYEDVLQDMLNLCAEYLETEQYLLPTTKHCYLKAMSLGIALLDGEGEDKDFTKRKRLRLDKIGKAFRQTPIVPVFGDIAIYINSIFIKSPHYSSARWDFDSEEHKATVARNYLLVHQLDFSEVEYKQCIARCAIAFKSLTSRHPDTDKTIYIATKDCLHLLSKLVTKVLEQVQLVTRPPINFYIPRPRQFNKIHQRMSSRSALTTITVK